MEAPMWEKLKSLYREGLGHRYGKSMQSIAGLHFNFSLADELVNVLREKNAPQLERKDFKSKLYFQMIRGYRRYNWILAYLLEAPPCVDESF